MFFAHFLVPSIHAHLSTLVSRSPPPSGNGERSASLQKSVLQRQAKMEPEPSSVMSLWAQSASGTRGSSIEPRSTRVGKHSRSVAEMAAENERFGGLMPYFSVTIHTFIQSITRNIR